MTSNVIQNIFHLSCLLATVALQIQCLLNYFRNEDVSIVEYKTLSNPSTTLIRDPEDNFYPSISFCIINPFLESKLKSYGNGINTTSYSKFLQGDLWDDRMLKIDYDDVTVSLNGSLDNSTGHAMWTRFKNRPTAITFHRAYTSLKTSTLKCFTVDAPKAENRTLDSFGIILKSTFFPNKIRPADMKHDKPVGFLITFHYPNQIFAPSNLWEKEWKPRDNSSYPYSMMFRIRTMTTIKNRRKSENNCIERNDNFDQSVFDSIIKEIGCRPFFGKTQLSTDHCINISTIPFSYDYMNEIAESNPPCNFIEHIDFTYHEDDTPDISIFSLSNCLNYFMIILVIEKDYILYSMQPQSFSVPMPSDTFGIAMHFVMKGYLEIKQERAYTFTNLVGNAGGYMGLFLGYAILHFPTLISNIVCLIEKWYTGK